MHASNVYHNEWAGKLAELLVTLTQREGGLGYAPNSTSSGDAKVFFSNSGTEANEGALKIARKVGKDRGGESKSRIACFENSCMYIPLLAQCSTLMPVMICQSTVEVWEH